MKKYISAGQDNCMDLFLKQAQFINEGILSLAKDAGFKTVEEVEGTAFELVCTDISHKHDDKIFYFMKNVKKRFPEKAFRIFVKVYVDEEDETKGYVEITHGIIWWEEVVKLVRQSVKRKQLESN